MEKPAERLALSGFPDLVAGARNSSRSLAHHQANPGERGVSMHELRAKLLGADKTPQPSP